MANAILIKNGEGLDAEFFVLIDNHIIDVKGNVTAGVYRLFQCSFVFRLRYSPEVLHFIRLFERIVKIRTIPPVPAIERILDKIAITMIE